MKYFIFALVLVTSNAIASQSFDCDFVGPNQVLTINDDQSITLKSNLVNYNCQKGSVNFPGTEIDLPVINCKSKNRTQMYYFTLDQNENIVLSRDLGITKDILCTKI